MTRVLVVGASTRAAAESAAHAGFDVTALDGYADRDQHPAVRALSITRDCSAQPTASALARAARGIDCDAVVYLSPFENHPRAVATLAAGRALWGNSPETLRRVRDPLTLAAAFRRNGFAVPRLLNPNDPNAPSRWVLKPFRSGGGNQVRAWQGGAIPRGCYVQEQIDGTPGSLVFVAAAGKSIPLGFSRQLVGDPVFGAAGRRYCGSIIASVDDEQFSFGDKLLHAAIALAECMASELRVSGLNGIDFVARDGVPYPVEVNPRWSSSMEVAEALLDATFISVHADACTRGTLPAFNLVAALRQTFAIGKAVVYARHVSSVGDTSTWLHHPTLRDVPQSGERFRVGQPVCTVMATGRSSSDCYRALADAASRVYKSMTSCRDQAVAGSPKPPMGGEGGGRIPV